MELLGKRREWVLTEAREIAGSAHHLEKSAHNFADTSICRLSSQYPIEKTKQESLLHDSIDPATATLVRLAADGHWFADLLDFAALEGRLCKELLATLLSLKNKTRDGRRRVPLKERP
jgi:hypothetical protein